MRRIGFAAFWLVTASAGIAAVSAWNPLPLGRSSDVLEAFQQNDAARLKELNRIIEREIGTPTADQPSQCKSIPFGSKPCGGPARYLVYSTAKTNESRLTQLVHEFNALQKKINEERKLMSDCSFVTEPQVELVDKVCTIRDR
ncbi:MAG TPA: hypothetical protein VJQ55_13075 [Candidatus Binatia bacterium]|nr:hypothetical protein [Candidatus Binatia bacterium]